MRSAFCNYSYTTSAIGNWVMPLKLRASIQDKLTKMKSLPANFREWLSWKMYIISVTLKSLFYTQHFSLSYMLEVLMEPMVWIVDHFSKSLGPVLVCGVVVLTSSVVAVVYWLGLPHYRDNRPWMYAVLMPYGHWLLINVVFHFFMACTTEPGTPMKAAFVVEAVGVCKKCVAPKPPRTHHCSVCNKCILKMDHHCPWINNCVGNYNHRYFFMYMVFMILGCLFIMIFGAEIAYNEIWLGGSDGPALRDTFYRWCGLDVDDDDDMEDIVGYPIRMNDTHLFRVEDGRAVDGVVLADERQRVKERELERYWLRFSITYAGLLTMGAFLSLGVLFTWHTKLISAGETSIEQLINAREGKRLAAKGEIYENPYDFGRLENWKLFLGIYKGSGRGFIRGVLLPSRHLPLDTGFSWHTRYGCPDADACPIHESQADNLYSASGDEAASRQPMLLEAVKEAHSTEKSAKHESIVINYDASTAGFIRNNERESGVGIREPTDSILGDVKNTAPTDGADIDRHLQFDGGGLQLNCVGRFPQGCVPHGHVPRLPEREKSNSVSTSNSYDGDAASVNILAIKKPLPSVCLITSVAKSNATGTCLGNVEPKRRIGSLDRSAATRKANESRFGDGSDSHCDHYKAA